jgi:hypothetical protein
MQEIPCYDAIKGTWGDSRDQEDFRKVGSLLKAFSGDLINFHFKGALLIL